MRHKRLLGVMLGIIGVVFIAAGSLLPLIAQDTVQPYMGIPASGTWHGEAYFGPEAQQLAAPITFDMNADGSVFGYIQFDFRYDGMAENLIELMNAHGCVVAFDVISPGSNPVSGYFATAEQVVGAFTVNACYLEGYGDLAFGAPISGVWHAERAGENTIVSSPVEPTASAEAASAATPVVNAVTSIALDASDPDIMAAAIEVYLDYCSECHGMFGEGGSGAADLTDRKVRHMTDEEIMNIINFGVTGTEMEPWQRLLTEEEKAQTMLVIRHPEVLKERYRN